VDVAGRSDREEGEMAVLIEGSRIGSVGPRLRVQAGKARNRHGRWLDGDLARVKRLAYESREYVVDKSGVKMPTI
jgi:hypothetical protein